MPKSLRNKVKHLCYNGTLTEKERDRILKALEQQPCEDCISIESVIEWLKDKDIIKTKNQEENARRELDELPPVTPERPKGKWIYKMQVMNNPYTYKCSVCKGWEKDKTKYCPNCGAEMSGGGEDEGDSN